MSASSYLIIAAGRLFGKEANKIRQGGNDTINNFRDPTFSEFMVNLVVLYAIILLLIFLYDVWKKRSLKSFDFVDAALLSFWITVVFGILEMFAFVFVAITNVE